MDNCLFFKRRSSSHHFLLALRHFDVMLCKYRSDNNGNEKGTETWRLTRSQNVTFSTPPGTEVAPAPDGGGCALRPSPFPAGRAGAGGRRGSTAGSWPRAGAATSPLLPPPPSRDGHLLLAGPAGSAWAPLGALPKKQLCARALETVINSQDFFFFFFTLPASAIFALGAFRNRKHAAGV